MSFLQGRDLKIQNLADLVKAARPDVVCLQECSLTDPLVVLGGEGWHCRSAGEFCLASRYPILDFEELHRPEKNSRIIAVRARLSRSGKAIPFISVHLMTLRRGLKPLIDWRGGGIDSFREIASVQRLGSELLRRWVEGTPESIVLAGDFNLTADRCFAATGQATETRSPGRTGGWVTRCSRATWGSGSITFSADQHGGHDGATLALTWARPTCPLWPTWLRVRSSARVPLDSLRRFRAIPGRPACWAYTGACGSSHRELSTTGRLKPLIVQATSFADLRESTTYPVRRPESFQVRLEAEDAQEFSGPS